MLHDVIIIGSGPAGLTAAIYAARANLKPVLIAGTLSGGQLLITSDVENYPGFPNSISGPELVENMREQAIKFGTTFIDQDATAVDLSSKIKKVMAGQQLYKCKCVIIATGASAMWLGLPNEQRLQSHGVSACATCDGFFFKGKDIAVVGGGDTAMEEATFLTRFAKTVTIIHRRSDFRASKIMLDRAMNNPKITFLCDTEVVDVLGKTQVDGLLLVNNKTNEEFTLMVQGLFIAIGHKPNTDLFVGQVELNAQGYINKKSLPDGVFAAGDVHDYTYRQAVTAAGSGCKAALKCERYLEQ